MVIDTFCRFLLSDHARNPAVTFLVGSVRAAGLCIALACCFLLSSQAGASHYRLAGAGFVSKAEIKALKGVNVTSTKALLEAGLDKKSRTKLARGTRLPLKRINALVLKCDLLRIPGVGPTVVRLFQDAGYKHTKSLKRAPAAEVWKKVSASNGRLRLVPEAPAKELVAAWVGSAKRLPAIVKGLK